MRRNVQKDNNSGERRAARDWAVLHHGRYNNELPRIQSYRRLWWPEAHLERASDNEEQFILYVVMVPHLCRTGIVCAA